MAKDDWIYAALLVLGASALAAALRPKCPICKSHVNYQESICRNCGSIIRWK